MSHPDRDSRSTSLRRIGLYLLLTIVLSSIFYAPIILTGHLGSGGGKYVLLLMWMPGLAALVTCRLSGQSVQSLGWRWGAWKWQWLSYFIPLAYATVAYSIIWLAGWGGFPSERLIGVLRTVFALNTAPAWVVLTLYFLVIAVADTLTGATASLGEEIGWRGFLTPHMATVFGFRVGAVLTGLIWAAWHMPILLWADYNAGTPWWFAMPCFTIMAVSLSVAAAWLRLKSGSLWTATILHASHNNFIQGFFTPATSARGWITPYAIDEFGFMLAAVSLAVAVVFWRRAKEVEQLPDVLSASAR